MKMALSYRVFLERGQYAIHQVFLDEEERVWAKTEDPIDPGKVLQERVMDMSGNGEGESCTQGGVSRQALTDAESLGIVSIRRPP